MNRKLKIISMVSVVVFMLVGGIYFFFQDSFLLEAKSDTLVNVNIVNSKDDKTYKVIDNPENISIYNLKYQETVENVINKLKQKEKYNIFRPLFILNPYGTNTTGMYMYFKTNVPVSIRYTISVDGFEDYSNTLLNTQDSSKKLQEGQIIGFLQGYTNKLTLSAYNEDGDCIEEQTFSIKIPDFETITEPVIEMTERGDVEQLSSGLFAIFGYNRKDEKEKRHILFYDNNGIIRAEIPLKVSNGDVNIKMVGDNILYTCSDEKFCLVNSLGKIEQTFAITGYNVHHDFDYDGDNKVVILADKNGEDTVEDLVITLDLKTGKVTETLDFKEILPDIYERAVLPEGKETLDWIHFNTVDIINGKDLLLSSRELSTIIRINNVYTEPTLAYFIADETIWADTGYEDLVLEKVGKFNSQTGQHTVTYAESSFLEEGQYYIYLYNNNWGYSSTMPKFDWTFIPEIGTITKDAKNSSFYKYLIDENKGTYRLVERVELPYSSIVSSVQEYGDNMVYCSGKAYKFGEYGPDNELLAEFTMDIENYTYRVFKYSMEGFWF